MTTHDADQGGTVTRGVLRLCARASALAAVTALMVLGVVVCVPDGNDYARATVKKHARLAASGPGKVVFVGGSNLAYGLDSAMVERTLGRPVVNMGMNGYLGVRYMLEEVRPSLTTSDIVVVALEYDSFYKSADGTASNLLMVAKENPRAFWYLSPAQRWDIAAALPYVAQQKLLRLARETGSSLRSRLPGGEPEGGSPLDLIQGIESLAGFNHYGDLVSHLGVTWPTSREDGVDASTTPIDTGVVAALAAFAGREAARGVSVLISYTPVIQSYYDEHGQALEALHQRLSRESSLVIPSPPATYALPESSFFDTVYHLNERGRTQRTSLVLEDIQRQLGPTARLAGAPQDASSSQGE